MVRRPPLPRGTDDDALAAILWDRNVTADQMRAILADPAHPDRPRLLGALLREARPDEVWRWITPAEVAAALPAVSPFLGRKRAFWHWLFDGWARLGLV